MINWLRKILGIIRVEDRQTKVEYRLDKVENRSTKIENKTRVGKSQRYDEIERARKRRRKG